MQLPGNTRPRPLSPHLQVYRPIYTLALSILHRASGLLLSAASLFLVAWLGALASGAGAYERVTACFASLPMRLFFAAVLAAFWYHLFAGLRHLFWDAGYGFGRKSARASGKLIVFLTASAVVATLWLTPAGRWLGVAG